MGENIAAFISRRKQGGTLPKVSAMQQAHLHANLTPTGKTQMSRLADIDFETHEAIRAFIERIARQYEMDGAILFGSRARHSHHPDSDADVAVLLHGHSGKFLVTKLAMADVAYEVLLETGIRIQPLPIWRDEWEHPEGYSNPRLLHNIEREGIRF